MSEKRFYRHIGYYNNVPDICALGGKTAETIVGWRNSGMGHFYAYEGEHEEDTDIIIPDETDYNISVTRDGLYAIKDDTSDWSFFGEYKARNKNLDWSNEETNDSGFFIDIYELYKIEIEGVEFYRKEE